MNATNDTRRRLICAFCCLALALFFLTDPVTRLSVRGDGPRRADRWDTSGLLCHVTSCWPRRSH